MLKRTLLIIVVISICFMSFVSCKNGKDTKVNNTDANNQELTRKLNIAPKSTLLGLTDKYVIYYSDVGEQTDDTADSMFYKYDLVSDISTELGMVENQQMHSLDYAFINNRQVILTLNVVDGNERINRNYEIDYVDNTVTLLSEYRSEPPLVFNRAFSDSLYTRFQPELIKGNQYRYNIYLGDGNEENIKKIIETENIISCLCSYDGYIYTIEYRKNDGEELPYLIKYDAEGKEIEIKSIEILSEFIATSDGVWELTISDSLYSFNALGQNLALNIKNGEFVKNDKLSVDRMAVIRPTTYIKQGQNVFIYFNRNNRKVYRYTVDTDELYEYEFSDVYQVAHNDEYLICRNKNGEFFYKSIY